MANGLDASGWVPDADWVLTQRDWYLEGCEHQELAFGEPYYDSQTGQVCVSASVRMDYDRAVRVMAVDVYLDRINMMRGEKGGPVQRAINSSSTVI